MKTKQFAGAMPALFPTWMIWLLVLAACLGGQAAAQNQFMITTSPGAGGGIYPVGPIQAPAGTRPTFFIIPNQDFSIQDVMVGGVSVGNDSQVQLPPLSANVTIAATFIKSPAVTATAAGPGTISPSGKGAVGYGGSRKFDMEAAPGNMLSALTVNNVAVALPTPRPSKFSHTVTNIIATTTVKATFALDSTKVILTSTAGAGGSISPLGKVEALKGSSRTYTITPNTGFYILDVKVDGKSVGRPTSHTLSNIQKAQTIAATFAKNPVVTVKQAAGGTISPAGPVNVPFNGSVFFSFSAASGYAVDKILINGKAEDGATGKTIFSIQKNTTVSAIFKVQPNQIPVTSTAGAGGSISPLGKVLVAQGGSRTFFITPAAGYRIADVKVNGVSKGAVSSTQVTDVQKPVTVAATFVKNPVISAKQAEGGTITPSGDVSVSLGGSQSFTITPAMGYEIKNLIIDGKPQPTAGSHTFTNVTKNGSISAVFALSANYVTVTANTGKGGRITPAGKSAAAKGSSPVFTLFPDANYRALSVKMGTQSLPITNDTVTIPNIQANAVLTAAFTKLPTITVKQAPGGTVGPAGVKVLAMGGSQKFNINPLNGYKIDSLLVDGKPVAAADSYEFTNVTTNRTLSAKFSLATYVVTSSSPPAGSITPVGATNVLSGKDQSFKVTPPAGFKAGIRVDGILKAQKPDGGELVYVLKNVRKNTLVEAVFAPIGVQFAGTLAITPVGLGQTIHVANKSPAVFNLLTNGTLGVAGVFYHNITAVNWGRATQGASENNWSASVPMVPGDNQIWFAAVGNDGAVAWYPTMVTYYPQSDFTTPLTPYVSNQPISTLAKNTSTNVIWRLGLLNPAGAVVTLYQVGENDELTQAVVMRDDGLSPDDINGDGIFSGSTSITTTSSGYLYYRAGVQKPGAATYYSETKELWVPEPLSDAQVNLAGEKADGAAQTYEEEIGNGKTPQEAAQIVVDLLKQDPDIGEAGATEEGGVWWITKDGILGLHHPELPGQKGGDNGGGAPPLRGPAPVILTEDQARNPPQNPFYSTADLATLFGSDSGEISVRLDGSVAPAPTTDGVNRIKSDRAIIISPFINNPNGGNFGNNDDYYKPWPTIQAHKTCGLYAAREVVNNGSVNVTLDDFKNLSNYGYIHISTHGDNYYNGLLSSWSDVWGPSDFLYGSLSVVGLNSGIQLFKDVNGKYVKGAYENDLNLKRLAIGKSGKLYMMPKFFQDYLTPLPNSVVVLSACRSGFNGSLMNVFLSKGAGTVVGYTDYVSTSYAQNTLQELVDRMYEDKTVLQALQSAVAAHGTNDNDSDPAYLVYMGATDLKFPSSELANGGFEDGVVEPWQRTGDGRVITGLGIERPKEGKFMGIISTGLGFTTSAGSIQQRFCVPDAGGTLSFRWNFYSEEWLEYVGSQFQDAFSVSVAVVDPTTGATGPFTTLFNKTIDGLAGQVIPADVKFDRVNPPAGDTVTVYRTTWRIDTLNLNAYSGKTLILRFGATDVGDSIYDSAILLDEIKLIPGVTPP